MRTTIALAFACLFLSACADNRIYSPIRVTCWDTRTGKTEENTAVAGITVGTGWFRTERPMLAYTDMDWKQVDIDLTHKKCAIAAYRDDAKLPYKGGNK